MPIELSEIKDSRYITCNSIFIGFQCARESESLDSTPVAYISAGKIVYAKDSFILSKYDYEHEETSLSMFLKMMKV
jgi:hypothetical protein